MRTHLITLAAALGLVGFVAASMATVAPAPAGGAHSGGGASAGAGSRGGGGSGGYSHASGGAVHGWYGGSGYAGHGGSYNYHGTHGSYGVVGSESARLVRGSAELQGVQTSRNALALGPRTGSAAKAALVTDSHRPKHPGHPRGPKHHHERELYTNNTCGLGDACASSTSPVCPFAEAEGATRGSSWAFDCPQAIKLKALPTH